MEVIPSIIAESLNLYDSLIIADENLSYICIGIIYGGYRMIYNNTKERCEILAEYLVENNETVRGVAQKFSISKSTVHKDITIRLKDINQSLYDKAKCILEKNKSERHLRGGEATRRKYLKTKKIAFIL